MSTEPERDIEKTLRDYARHRADTGGAPPALHPATRKLLQDEVARQGTGTRRASGLGLFWASWPGFILKGSVALAVLVVGGLILTPLWRGQPQQKQAMSLAKNEEVSNQRTDTDKKGMVRGQTSARDEFKPATPTPGGVALRKMDQSNVAVTESLKDVSIASNPATARSRANPVTTPAVMPPTAAPTLAMKSVPTPPATASATTAATAAPALAASRTAMPAATPPVTTTVLAPVTASDSIATLADRTAAETSGLANLGPINQQFTRVNPPARGGRGGGGGARGGAAALRATVLQSFRVEQNGGQIRVIDSDGSIYTGVVTLGGNLASQSAGPVATFAAAAQPAATNAPVALGYAFRVSGTNLTLNQPVEFSGNFVTNDSAASPQLALGASAAAGGRRAASGGGGGAGGGIGGGVAVNADNGSLASTNVVNATVSNLGQTTSGAVSPVPPFNFRLQGQAVIGTNRLGITAVPTKP